MVTSGGLGTQRHRVGAVATVTDAPAGWGDVQPSGVADAILIDVIQAVASRVSAVGKVSVPTALGMLRLGRASPRSSCGSTGTVPIYEYETPWGTDGSIAPMPPCLDPAFPGAIRYLGAFQRLRFAPCSNARPITTSGHSTAPADGM